MDAQSKKIEIEKRIAELEAENAILRQREEEWLQTRERELQLEQHLRNSGFDFPKNIDSLTKLCQDFLGSDFSFYISLREDKFVSHGQWNSSSEFNPTNGLISSLCRDLIQDGNEKFLHVPRLKDVAHYNEIKSDAFVGKFETFIGCAVEYGNSRVGVLGVLYHDLFTPNEYDKHIMTILATVIADEIRRNEALEALRESEQRFHNLADNLPGFAIQGYRPDGTVFYWNKGSEDVYGYAAEQAIGVNLGELIIPESMKKHFYKFLKTAEVVKKSGEFMPRGELVLKRKDNSPVSVYSVHTAVYTPEREPALFSVTIDLSLQKETEKALQESEERFRDLVNGIHDIVYSVDADGYCTFIGPQVSRYGFTPDEMLGKRFLDLVFSEDRALLADDFEMIRSGCKPYSRTVFRTVAKEGRIIWWENTGSARYDNAGGFESLAGNLRDITARKLMEEKLRLTRKELSVRNRIAQIFLTLSDDNQIGEELLTCILEATGSPYGMYGFIDDQGNLFCPSLMTEVSEQCRMTNRRLVFPRENWRGIWGQALQEKRTLYSNTPLSLPEGHIPISRVLVVPIIDHDEVIGNMMVANKKTDYDDGDISLLEAIADYLAPVLREKLQRDTEGKKRRQAEEERLEMERRLHHAQRLESLGILAGGIAHDFNNLLMAIMGNLEMVKLEIPSSSKAQAYLDASMNSSLRAADITRQMLAYSGKGRFLIREVELCDLIEEMLPLLERSLSETALLELDLCRPLPVILADAGQIRQILMNLVINASEAIGGQPGTITLKTGVISCDDAFLLRSRLEEKPAAGWFVDLQVADTGCGMDSATCDRLFDPFFTTKFTGRGLGMSAVLGIVRGHGGALMVDSEPAKGTIIRILFPLKEGFENTDATNVSEEILRKES